MFVNDYQIKKDNELAGHTIANKRNDRYQQVKHKFNAQYAQNKTHKLLWKPCPNNLNEYLCLYKSHLYRAKLIESRLNDCFVLIIARNTRKVGTHDDFIEHRFNQSITLPAVIEEYSDLLTRLVQQVDELAVHQSKKYPYYR